MLSSDSRHLLFSQLHFFSEFLDRLCFGFGLNLYLLLMRRRLSVKDVLDAECLDLVGTGVLKNFRDFAFFPKKVLDFVLQYFKPSFPFFLKFEVLLLFAFSSFNHLFEDLFLEPKLQVFEIVFLNWCIGLHRDWMVDCSWRILLHGDHSGLLKNLDLSLELLEFHDFLLFFLDGLLDVDKPVSVGFLEFKVLLTHFVH